VPRLPGFLCVRSIGDRHHRYDRTPVDAAEERFVQSRMVPPLVSSATHRVPPRSRGAGQLRQVSGDTHSFVWKTNLIDSHDRAAMRVAEGAAVVHWLRRFPGPEPVACLRASGFASLGVRSYDPPRPSPR
jgi:hypothetical protein